MYGPTGFGPVKQMRCLLYAPLDGVQRLPAALTFTRAAGANSYHSARPVNGTVFVTRNAGVNVPRYHWHPGLGRRGLLVEPARTNLFPRSDFSDTVVDDLPDAGGVPWGLGGGVAGVDFNTVVSATAPNGTAYFQLEDTAVANRGVDDAITIAAATTYATSALVRRTGTAGAASLFGYNRLGPGNSSFSIGAVNCDWTTFYGTAASVGAGASTGHVLKGSGDPPGVVQICCPQIEAGAYASTWIPTTTGSATRAIEACAINSANIPLAAGRAHLDIGFLFNSTEADSVNFCLSSGANSRIFAWSSAGNWYVMNNGGIILTLADAFSAGDARSCDFEWGPWGSRLSVAGVGVTSTAAAWVAPGVAASYVGSLTSAAGQQSAVYANLQIWG